ncbi:unnamed protein product [Cercospora beticola]|nr:unnamed protein product [Cercospora beticola]
MSDTQRSTIGECYVSLEHASLGDDYTPVPSFYIELNSTGNYSPGMRHLDSTWVDLPTSEGNYEPPYGTTYSKTLSNELGQQHQSDGHNDIAPGNKSGKAFRTISTRQKSDDAS